MSVTFDEYALIADVCRDSFYQFFIEFWEEVVHEPLELNWHIKYLCDQMQRCAERVFANEPKKYDLICNIPPGMSKSSIVSIMFPAWMLCRMPSARMICVSHATELALDLSRKSRDVVRCEKYQACFGVERKWRGVMQKATIINEDQDTKGYWGTTYGGSRLYATIGGRVPTGFHAHALLVDDPIDPRQVASEIELKEANRWMNEVLPSRKVDKRIAFTALIMQRLHQDDPSGNRLENKKAGKIKHICLPATLQHNVKPERLRRYYQECLLDPVRLCQEVLDEQQGILGDFAYAGQYDQNPVPFSGGLFRWEKFNMESPPPNTAFKRIVRSWDTASGIKDHHAFTAGVKIGITKDNRFWILDVVRGRWRSEQREAIILQTARMDGRTVKIILEQQGGGSGVDVVQSTIRNLAGFHVVADKPTGEKMTRSVPFSVQVNNANVYLPIGAPWIPDYIAEARYFPNSKFKDQIDATAQGFNDITRHRVVGGLKGF